MVYSFLVLYWVFLPHGSSPIISRPIIKEKVCSYVAQSAFHLIHHLEDMLISTPTQLLCEPGSIQPHCNCCMKIIHSHYFHHCLQPDAHLFIYYVIFTQEYPISVQHCSPWGSCTFKQLSELGHCGERNSPKLQHDSNGKH